MAKQKIKVGSKATPAADGASPEPARKLKSKRKARPVAAGSAGETVVATPALRGAVKRKAKPARKKALLAPRTSPLVHTLADAPAETEAARRPRKPGRPVALVGRLERLELAIAEVKLGARASLRTRKLLSAGTPKMAQKVIEEAAEVAIEAIRGDQTAFVNETVDLFYNLLALANDLGVPLEIVWAEMDRREQTLGMAEKLPKVSDL